jgi:hypothetical protein
MPASSYTGPIFPATWGVNPGILFIKVNRIDQNGIDNTISLQSLEKIKIKYSDIGIQTYDVLNITEYPDYYLFYVNPPTPATSSADNTIVDYKISATVTQSFSSASTGLIFTSSILSPLAWSTASLYPEGFTCSKTPNIPINVTFSGLVNTNGGLDGVNLYVLNSSGVSSLIGSIGPLGVGANNFTITSSFSLIEGDHLWAQTVHSLGVFTNSITASLLVTQSISPTSSVIDQIIFEPYLTENFINSDYNVLFNNAITGIFSKKYMGADYESGILIPTNFDLIISNSAFPAEVQDYYYNLQRHILPRYNGSKMYAANINYYTPPTNNAIFANGEINQQWGGDSLSSRDVIVSNPATYILYFEWIGGSPPEYKNGAGAKIKYLINENGEVSSPLLDNPYYYNLINAFEKNSLVQVSQPLTSPNDIPSNDYFPIYAAGKQFAPIIYSQTGSNVNAIPTMSFGNNSNTTDFKFISYISSSYYQDGGGFPGEAIQFLTSSGYSPTNVNWSPAPNSYITCSLANNNRIKLKTKITLTATTFSPLIDNPSDSRGICTGVIQIQSVPSTTNFNGNDTQVLAQLNFSVGLEQTITKTLETNYFYPDGDSKLRVGVFYESELGELYVQPPGTFLVIPELFTSLEVYSGSGQFYFQTGSTAKNILTGSPQFNEIIYDRDQTDVNGSGYFTTIPFTVEIGDTIRFEYNENKSYYIKEISTPEDSGSLYLTLDRNIENGTNVNSFLIRRLVDDPSFILLNDITAANINGGGFMIPQYISPTLKKEIPNIIKKLNSESLI